MTTLVQSIRAASRATLSVGFVASASTETTSYTHIVETSTSAAISVIAGMAADNSNTMSTMILSNSTSGKITSCAQTKNVWRKSSLCSTRKWTSRLISSSHIPMV